MSCAQRISFLVPLPLRHRPPNPRVVQAKRHFVQGAQLLAQARRSKSASAATSLAKQALAEVEKALALDPKDATSHLQGFSTNALDALDAALSPLAAGSLAEEEKGDALLKRAGLKIGMSGRRIDRCWPI
ncbi:hypothetical protein JHK82_033831 [Glycine max]|nr:hypothetical protein JHK85_034545 [Glycine max]KAG4986222.1 hypothetical protein JHK86_033913 [Glycine max]KAG5119411.1 hypothetical protein JHK82_033831 [Glycine max]KAG5140402.1 hypothetical protein JHK84_034170 [Glycine max]